MESVNNESCDEVEFNNRVPEEEDYNLEDLNFNISLKSNLVANKNIHLLNMQKVIAENNGTANASLPSEHSGENAF